MSRKTVIILLMVLMALTAVSWAVSDKWKLVIKVAGTVESQFGGQSRWEEIWQSRMLQDGDKARTLANSRARIKLSDNSIVTLGQNTEVEMSKYQVEPKSNVVELKLLFGKIRNNVAKSKGKKVKFEVKTPNAVLAARGTDFFVEYSDETAGAPQGGVTRLIVFSDTVELTAGGRSVLIHQGNSAMVGASGNIIVNPPGLRAAPPPAPGSAVTPGTNPDIDLVEYGPQVHEANAQEIPYDPHVPNTTGNPTAGTVQEGGSGPNVVPPSGGEGGHINVIIK